MKLAFVNIMQEMHRFDSTALITQPPVPLGILNAVTPKTIETGLIDEQADPVRFEGDAFAFSLSTQNAGVVYEYADALRAARKKVIFGGIHVTVCPEEASRHADAIVTGEAEMIWPEVCEDLLAGRLQERYAGSPTPPARMNPVDYTFFGKRRYLTPASLFATRGCRRLCSFCVSSRFMGPYRTKPLDVLEKEIDQLSELYPRSFLQFTDDNLLEDRSYRSELLFLIRRKKRRFISMITMDQFCDQALMGEMAASGCLGVAVGLESLDSDNCAAIKKYQNIQQAFLDAVIHTNGLGIQTAALLMVGLPHDSPERLSRTMQCLKRIPCSLFDLRILRVFPNTALYSQMLSSGEVKKEWWLDKDTPATCNHLLPSCLGVHFKHKNFRPMELQYWALKLTSELNIINARSAGNILRIGFPRHAWKIAGTVLTARQRAGKQARHLLPQVEQAMSA